MGNYFNNEMYSLKMKKLNLSKIFYFMMISILIFFNIIILSFSAYASSDSLCATVKIEIKQELTLERQAFEAHMRINNGLTHISLENVNVTVNFKDEKDNTVLASSNPDTPGALFFIRLDRMENINNVQGSGVVAPSTSADIHWLIIPSPGAANDVPQGTLYYVGATLTYKIGEEQHETIVTPDAIYVKPMPEITLDYFLPEDVYGDDAFTTQIEPSIPFTLGVRAKNTGFGIAKNFEIESAQPKIVDNELGLIIEFIIESCQINNETIEPTLLADFGDISPNTSSTARWFMTCSLSGQFIEFTAQYIHSDELGGNLTSLIKEINTHMLVQDVLVDLPGRDAVKDFLVKDGDTYKIYETENLDSDVTDQSAASNLQIAIQSDMEVRYNLSIPPTSGFMYVRLPDPYNGEKSLQKLIRSDGKIISEANAWLSKTRNNDNEWEYFFNLFDVNSQGSYIVIFEDPEYAPQPPVIQFIPDRDGEEKVQISFIVEASDPNGTIPSLSTSALPVGADFVDLGNGTGYFDWTPAMGQAGEYDFTLSASDGVLQSSRTCVVKINPTVDKDGDNMLDDWEIQYFGAMDRDGSADYDGDGLTDKEEFDFCSNPTILDTDADGHEDGAEKYNITDPNNKRSYKRGVFVSDSSGNDDWDGTCPIRIGQWNAGPKKTINNALNIAMNNYFIMIDAGEYSENILLEKQGIKLQSHDGPYLTKIVGSSELAAVVISADSILEGLTITNSEGGGVYAESSKLTIDNVIIKNCAEIAVDCFFVELTLNRSKINGNLQTGISGASSSIINVYYCEIYQNMMDAINCQNSDCYIYNSIIFNNQTAVSLSSAYSIMKFVTICDNTLSGIVLNGNSTLNIKNSILWGNSNQIVKTDSDSVSINYSDIQNTYDGIENIALDPEFVNSIGLDYHLTSISPCIDAGDPFEEVDSDQLDYDGKFRFIDGTNLGEWQESFQCLLYTLNGVLINWGTNLIPDMGAYEYDNESELGDHFILETSDDLINWQQIFSGRKSNYLDNSNIEKRFYRVIKDNN